MAQVAAVLVGSLMGLPLPGSNQLACMGAHISGGNEPEDRYAREMQKMDHALRKLAEQPQKGQEDVKAEYQQQCTQCMQNIQAIGEIDAEVATTKLGRIGISAQRRLQMEAEYQKLIERRKCLGCC